MDLSLDLVIKLAYALGIGVLIGLERALVLPSDDSSQDPSSTDDEGAADGVAKQGATETAEEQTATTKVATKAAGDIIGVRTYTIYSLVGFTAAVIGSNFPAAAPVVIGGLILLIISLYWRTRPTDPGITTEAAAIGCCALGMLAYTHPHAAGVLALLVTVVLALKRFTHVTLRRLRRVELTDTLKFLVIILIILPILPNRALDPYGAFNPYKVVLLVILISGISFVGYFLTKFLGAQKGLGLTGLVGGLTSSTAVTAAMAQQAKEQPELRNPCAFATIVANATMFARVLVVVGLLDFALMLRLAWGVGAMTVVAIISVVILWFRKPDTQPGGPQASGKVEVKNPFSLGPAIKFAGFFVLILVVAKVAKLYFGNSGLYLASLVSGLADVDAITLSVSEQSRNLASAGKAAEHAKFLSVGAIAIVIAVVSNSIVKTGIAIYSGGWKFGWLVGLILFAATGAGLAVLVIV